MSSMDIPEMMECMDVQQPPKVFDNSFINRKEYLMIWVEVSTLFWIIKVM